MGCMAPTASDPHWDTEDDVPAAPAAAAAYRRGHQQLPATVTAAVAPDAVSTDAAARSISAPVAFASQSIASSSPSSPSSSPGGTIASSDAVATSYPSVATSSPACSTWPTAIAATQPTIPLASPFTPTKPPPEIRRAYLGALAREHKGDRGVGQRQAHREGLKGERQS